MKEGERLSLERIQAFLAGSGDLGFEAANRKQLYQWTGKTLCVQEYQMLGRAGGRKFRARYQAADIALLAEVDEAHDTLSGPATKKLLNRGWHEYADARYENMADISASHIYNLRKRTAYREKRMVFEKTRPTPVSIGERRKPESGGKPGYIRVDLAHQGDLNGTKGVHHIRCR